MARRTSFKATNTITTNPSNITPARSQPVVTAMPNQATATHVTTPIQAKLEATSTISDLEGFTKKFNIR